MRKNEEAGEMRIEGNYRRREEKRKKKISERDRKRQKEARVIGRAKEKLLRRWAPARSRVLRQATASQLPQMFRGPKKVVMKKDQTCAVCVPRDEDNEYLCTPRWDKFHDADRLIEGGHAVIRSEADVLRSAPCPVRRFRGSLSSLSPPSTTYHFLFDLSNSPLALFELARNVSETEEWYTMFMTVLFAVVVLTIVNIYTSIYF